MSSENKFKNEMQIKIGEVEILLRPTMENIASVESLLGGVQYLAFKYGRGIGKSDPLEQAKYLPTMVECSKIIYLCQARHNPENPELKEYSQEQVFQMLMGSMKNIPAQIMIFMGRMLAGNKMAPDFSENTKKNSSNKSQKKTP